MNVFKPGSGKIEVWENSGGKRGGLLYSLPNIPLTPGCAALFPFKSRKDCSDSLAFG